MRCWLRSTLASQFINADISQLPLLPIIATGGALGSLVGQVLRTTPVERKTLLAAGAAAGMAATFGTPLAAVLLSVELLLFEFRPRSLVPVALAAATAAGARVAVLGGAPVFPL